ncbi:hypothetical protein D3C75_1146080 [compost metagenome]
MVPLRGAITLVRSTLSRRPTWPSDNWLSLPWRSLSSVWESALNFKAISLRLEMVSRSTELSLGMSNRLASSSPCISLTCRSSLISSTWGTIPSFARGRLMFNS